MTTKKATALTLSEIDSHHETMSIHLNVADHANNLGAWATEINALQSALKHANVLQDSKSRSEIFSKLNSARAKQRRAAKTVVKADTSEEVSDWTDAPQPST